MAVAFSDSLPTLWFMEEPSQFSVNQTAQSLTCSIIEKPHTGLDDCLNMLLSCFRARNSAPTPPTPTPPPRQQTSAKTPSANGRNATPPAWLARLPAALAALYVHTGRHWDFTRKYISVSGFVFLDILRHEIPKLRSLLRMNA